MSASAGNRTDAELLRQHVAGDPDAFGELFRRHRDRLWAVALRTVGDQEEAADALQDGMLSAFRRAGDFRGDAAVTTWLHRIVVNACLDRLRRRAVRPATLTGDMAALDALSSGSGSGFGSGSGSGSGSGFGGGAAADQAGAVASRMDVDAALRVLPPPQRAAIVLVDMLGFSVDDAAAVLGVSPGTVKSRCARSRARLLPHLAHLRPGAELSEPSGPSGPSGPEGPEGPAGNPAAVERVSPHGGDV